MEEHKHSQSAQKSLYNDSHTIDSPSKIKSQIVASKDNLELS